MVIGYQIGLLHVGGRAESTPLALPDSEKSGLFSIVFGNDIIMTSFYSHNLQIHIFCRNSDGLSSCKFSMLQAVFGKFYRQIKKNTMKMSSLRHFMFLGFENLKFCKTGYRLSSSSSGNSHELASPGKNLNLKCCK